MKRGISYGQLILEFEERQEPIFLKPYEICVYKDICQFSNLGTEVPCFGCIARDWNFVCDIKRLKGE